MRDVWENGQLEYLLLTPSELEQEAAGPYSALKGSDIQALGIDAFLDDTDCLSWGCCGFSTHWFLGNKVAFQQLDFQQLDWLWGYF